MSREDFVDIIVGHKDELVKSEENQESGFKVAKLTILNN